MTYGQLFALYEVETRPQDKAAPRAKEWGTANDLLAMAGRKPPVRK